MRRTYVEACTSATSKIVVVSILSMAVVRGAQAQAVFDDMNLLRQTPPSVVIAPPPPMTLDQARASAARCASTEWQPLIYALLAAEPEADAGKHADAGDFTTKPQRVWSVEQLLPDWSTLFWSAARSARSTE